MSEKIATQDVIPRQRDGQRGYALSDMLREAPYVGGTGTSTTQRRLVRTIDPEPRDLRGVKPLKPVAFVDGVQNALIVRHVEHRPVTLAWVAAGAVVNRMTVLRIRQEAALIASSADAELVERLGSVGGGVPCLFADELTPWGVAAATQAKVDSLRRELEREIVTTVPIPAGAHLVVDGSIRGYQRDGIVGIVKSVDTQFLGDESVLPDRAGWRSPVFELPATLTTDRSVLSAYVRLHDAPGSVRWDHGLVRAEAQDIDSLDAACAMAVGQRQGPGSGDGRWSVHLEAMRGTELALGAFRPWVFERL